MHAAVALQLPTQVYIYTMLAATWNELQICTCILSRQAAHHMDLKMPLRLTHACIASAKPFSTLPRSSALISRVPAFSVHSRSCACVTCVGANSSLPRRNLYPQTCPARHSVHGCLRCSLRAVCLSPTQQRNLMLGHQAEHSAMGRGFYSASQ